MNLFGSKTHSEASVEQQVPARDPPGQASQPQCERRSRRAGNSCTRGCDLVPTCSGTERCQPGCNWDVSALATNSLRYRWHRTSAALSKHCGAEERTDWPRLHIRLSIWECTIARPARVGELRATTADALVGDWVLRVSARASAAAAARQSLQSARQSLSSSQLGALHRPGSRRWTTGGLQGVVGARMHPSACRVWTCGRKEHGGLTRKQP